MTLLLRGVFAVLERAASEDVRARIAAQLRDLDPRLEPALPALLTLLDVPLDDTAWEGLAPHQRRQRMLEALKHLLLAESRWRPTLVIFEDLHWLDAETQALLDGLVESLPAARLGRLTCAPSLELCGGSIMNVVRDASLQALENGDSVVTVETLQRGIRGEHAKEGKGA